MEEDYLFFGRHQQIEDLVRRLRTSRLVAVVGTSGSGKSSLVRAGLLPTVLGGGMAQSDSAWEIAVMRPGGSPIEHLARALCEAGLYDADAEDALFHLKATLSRSRNGLIESLRQSHAARGSKLLLVVDQFEELFRFNRVSAASQEESVGFVNLLLRAAQHADRDVYVVLTMRSDFLGECSQFLGLAEAVNDGGFLIPRMTRDQIQQAIEGPIRVRGAELAPRLLFRLLNDVEDNQDQLPVLQHALMRTWDLWEKAKGKRQTGETNCLNLEHYEATGGMRAALSRHADEVFEALPSDQHRAVAGRVFKALTERGADGRGVRRLSQLSVLVDIAGADETVVRQVVEAYRAPSVTFLMPPVTSPLDDSAVIDISHESLMRVWDRLRGWVEEEAQWARIYGRLRETAALHSEKRAGLYHDPDLQIALCWRDSAQPNQAWAKQYSGGFEESMRFLDQSREAVEREEKERETARQRELERARDLAETQAKIARLFKRFAGSLAVGLLLAVGLTLWAFKLRSEANRLRTEAETQTEKTQQALLASNHERGKGLLVMARGRLQQNDIFAAKIIAGSAIGFSGFGRADHGADFAEAYPDLLLPGSAEHAEVQRLLRGEPDFMRLWASPSPRHHRRLIEAVFVRRNGRTAISVERFGTIKVWDLESGDLLRMVDGSPLSSVDLSPDGHWLAAAARNGTIQVWDAATWEQTHLLTGHDDAGGQVLFGPENLVFESEDGVLKVWKTGEFSEQLAPLGTTRAGHPLAFHPGGLLLMADAEQRLGLLDLKNGEVIDPGLDLPATFAAFSPDGQWLVTSKSGAGQDPWTLRLFRCESEPPKATLAAVRLVNAGAELLTFSPDSRTLVCSGSGMIYPFRVPDLGGLPPIKGLRKSVDHLSFTPDGQGILAAGGEMRRIEYLEMPSGKPKNLITHFGGNVQAVFSPDGRFFASTAGDGDVRIWETATGHSRVVLRRSIVQGSGTVAPVFRPDGAVVASGWPDGTIHLSDTSTGADRGVLQSDQGAILSLAAHPAGLVFASGGSDGSVRFWSWDGKELADLRSHRDGRGTQVYALAFSPDGEVLAFNQENEIELWDWARKEPIRPPFKGHATPAHSLAFSPDGTLLASAGRYPAHGETRLWDLRSGVTLERWYEDNVYASAQVAFTPDGRHFVRALGKRVEWYEIGREQGITTRRLAVLDKQVYDPSESIALSPDGRLLLTAHEESGLELWEVSRGKEALAWSNPDDDEFSYWAMDLSPNGELLATGTRNGLIRIWELATGRLLHSFKADETLRANYDSDPELFSASHTPKGAPKDAVASIRFSPDGQRLYSVYDRSGLITMWEFKDDWREVKSVDNGQPAVRLALSPDGALLATAGQGVVRIWDANSLQLLGRMNVSDSLRSQMDLAFHPNRSQLAVRAEGVRVFDLTHPEAYSLVHHIQGLFTSLTYSPDGQYLAALQQSSGDRLYDAATGDFLRSTVGPTDDTRWSCDFSPDGRWLATGAGQKMVRLWNVQTGEPAGALPGHADRVSFVRFTPDGRRLVTVCSQTVRIWDVDQVLHGTLDYASHLDSFHIEGEKVVGAFPRTILSTNLHRAVSQPFRESSGHSILGLLRPKEAGKERTQAELLAGLFWQYYRAHNLTSAKAALDQLESYQQGETERAALVGLCRTTARGRIQNQNFPLARREIEMAIELAPDDFVNWQTKAEILQFENDYPNALSAAEQATRLAPDNAESWAIKATVLGKQLNREAAAQAWGRALALTTGRQKDTYLAMSKAGEPVPPTPDEKGWIELFDGRTLSGWTTPDPSGWEIKNGELIGQGAKSHLFSPYTYTNLEFRAEANVAPAGNGGMYFRAPYGAGDFNGYEAQVANTHRDPVKTGSLYRFSPVYEQLVEDETWFTQHVVAIGNRIVIRVNDRIVTDFIDENHTYTSGHLALQQMGNSIIPGMAPRIVVRYRNVMVKPLPSDPVAAWAEAEKDLPALAETSTRLQPPVERPAQDAERAAHAQQIAALRRNDPGAIKQWLLLAPIPFAGIDRLAVLEAEQLAQEANLRPRAGQRVPLPQRELFWTPLYLEDYKIDFNLFLGKTNEYRVAYAVCYVESESDHRNLSLKVGSDDQAKIYLNGQEVYRHEVGRAWRADQDTVAGIDLNMGLNVLVFKVVNQTRGWEGSVWITDADGQPVPGLRVFAADQ